MPAYMIVDIDVRDPERYEDYKREVPRLIQKHGGEYLVRGGEVEVLEGSWKPGRLVVFRFPSRQAIRDLSEDPEYRPLKALRQEVTRSNVVAAEEVRQTSKTAETRFALPGCVVRSFETRDAESLAAHANCRDVWLNLRDGFPHPYTRADAERFIRKSLLTDPETVFAIAVDGQAVGGIGFRLGEDVERTGAEVGYWIGKAFWGRGIMTQALAAVRDHAIRNHSLTRVFALPFEWNPASFRVLEKAGFVLEGRLRRAVVKDGRVIDQLMYAYVIPEGEQQEGEGE